ncbi:hypothetical protein ACFL2D_01870 [Patescibacteria group bacterium]
MDFTGTMVVFFFLLIVSAGLFFFSWFYATHCLTDREHKLSMRQRQQHFQRDEANFWDFLHYKFRCYYYGDGDPYEENMEFPVWKKLKGEFTQVLSNPEKEITQNLFSGWWMMKNGVKHAGYGEYPRRRFKTTFFAKEPASDKHVPGVMSQYINLAGLLAFYGAFYVLMLSALSVFGVNFFTVIFSLAGPALVGFGLERIGRMSNGEFKSQGKSGIVLVGVEEVKIIRIWTLFVGVLFDGIHFLPPIITGVFIDPDQNPVKRMMPNEERSSLVETSEIVDVNRALQETGIPTSVLNFDLGFVDVEAFIHMKHATKDEEKYQTWPGFCRVTANVQVVDAIRCRVGIHKSADQPIDGQIRMCVRLAAKQLNVEFQRQMKEDPGYRPDFQASGARLSRITAEFITKRVPELAGATASIQISEIFYTSTIEKEREGVSAAEYRQQSTHLEGIGDRKFLEEVVATGVDPTKAFIVKGARDMVDAFVEGVVGGLMRAGKSQSQKPAKSATEEKLEKIRKKHNA